MTLAEPYSTSEGQRKASLAEQGLQRCLWLDLCVSAKRNSNNIYLTISFGRGRIEVCGGSIDFGLKEVELYANVKGGTIPLDLRWPKEEIRQETTIKRTQSKDCTRNQMSADGADVGLGEKGPFIKFTDSKSNNEEDKLGTKDEFDFSIHSITNFGPPTSPVWRFEILPGPQYLKGQISKKIIGTVAIDDDHNVASLSAFIEILKRSVVLLDSDGFLQNLATNSKSVIINALIRKHIYKKLKNCFAPLALEVSRSE